MKTHDKILHLPILVEQDEDDVYIVSCPVFKGCHSYGKTIDKALENLKEVIDICMDEEKEISNQPLHSWQSSPSVNHF